MCSMCWLSTFLYHLFFFDIFVVDSTANIPRPITWHILCQSLPAMPIPSSPQENCCPYIKLNSACHHCLDMLVGVPQDSTQLPNKSLPPLPPIVLPPVWVMPHHQWITKDISPFLPPFWSQEEILWMPLAHLVCMHQTCPHCNCRHLLRSLPTLQAWFGLQ